jgi:glycosyltransferase involved in cell wall biosynthesis
VPPRDAKALADAIVLLLQDKQLRRQFGENGRQKVNVECGPELIARKTRNVYLQAMSGTHQPIANPQQKLTEFR